MLAHNTCEIEIITIEKQVRESWASKIKLSSYYNIKSGICSTEATEIKGKTMPINAI